MTKPHSVLMEIYHCIYLSYQLYQLYPYISILIQCSNQFKPPLNIIKPPKLHGRRNLGHRCPGNLCLVRRRTSVCWLIFDGVIHSKSTKKNMVDDTIKNIQNMGFNGIFIIFYLFHPCVSSLDFHVPSLRHSMSWLGTRATLACDARVLIHPAIAACISIQFSSYIYTHIIIYILYHHYISYIYIYLQDI